MSSTASLRPLAKRVARLRRRSAAAPRSAAARRRVRAAAAASTTLFDGEGDGGGGVPAAAGGVPSIRVTSTPEEGYGDCYERLGQGSRAAAEWRRLLEYPAAYAPAPVEVVGDVLSLVGEADLDVRDWAELVRYMAVRCGHEAWQYDDCRRRAAELARRVAGGSARVAAAAAGLAVFARDAHAAVNLVRASGRFHSSAYAWIAFPPAYYAPSDAGSPLARVHLKATKQYVELVVRGGAHPVVVAYHALLQHAVVRDDARLFFRVAEEVVAAYAPGRPPALLPQTLALLRAAGREHPGLQPAARRALRALFEAGGVEVPATLAAGEGSEAQTPPSLTDGKGGSETVAATASAA
eukprot:Rhum_TRINITY_DN9697_c0_g1::Rhum_TRINITY_DN9697_c0_g1_i1::g.34682::m.34682